MSQRTSNRSDHLLPIPISIFGYSNLDNPFHDETLDRQFVWPKLNEKRQARGEKIPLATSAYLSQQAEQNKEQILAARQRREDFVRKQLEFQRSHEQIARDLELANAQDVELEQSYNTLCVQFKQCEFYALSDREAPIHIFIKYLLFKMKLESPDVLARLNVSQADSRFEKDRHVLFIKQLDVLQLSNCCEVIDVLSFDELITLYVDILNIIDLTSKAALYQEKMKLRQQNAVDPLVQLKTVLPIVSNTDIEYWTVLLHVVERECDVKYLVKVGFSLDHSLFIVMSAHTEAATLTFQTLVTQYKQFLNTTVTETIERTKNLHEKHQRDVYELLTSISAAPKYIFHHTTSNGKSNQTQNDGDTTTQSMNTDAYLIENTVPMTWTLSTGSGLPIDLVDSVYKTFFRPGQPPTLSQLQQVRLNLKKNQEQALQEQDKRHSVLTNDQQPILQLFGNINQGDDDTDLMPSLQPLESTDDMTDVMTSQTQPQGPHQPAQQTVVTSTLPTDDNNNNHNSLVIPPPKNVPTTIEYTPVLFTGIFHELEFAEYRCKLNIFFRRLTMIRTLQLQRLYDADVALLAHAKKSSSSSSSSTTTTTTQQQQQSTSIPKQQQEENLGSLTQQAEPNVSDVTQAQDTHELNHHQLRLFNKQQVMENDESAIRALDQSTQNLINTIRYDPRFQTRRPCYVCKVKTGFNWTKYNRAHFDKSNPPPKTVKGYRFHVFYPNLVDPNTTPSYTILTDANDHDYCILRFHAGPPYEDISFRIVRKKWNKLASQGFVCVFEHGCLTLSFNFAFTAYRR